MKTVEEEKRRKGMMDREKEKGKGDKPFPFSFPPN